MTSIDPLNIVKELNELVNKGARVFLYTLGGLVVIFGLASVAEPELASLTSGEFIAVIALGAVLIALGTLVTVYEFKTIHEEARHIRELGQKQAERGQEQTGTTAQGGNM